MYTLWNGTLERMTIFIELISGYYCMQWRGMKIHCMQPSWHAVSGLWCCCCWRLSCSIRPILLHLFNVFHSALFILHTTKHFPTQLLLKFGRNHCSWKCYPAISLVITASFNIYQQPMHGNDGMEQAKTNPGLLHVFLLVRISCK